MADETLKYVTLDTLKTYDGKLKPWVKDKIKTVKLVEADETTTGYLKTYELKFTDGTGETAVVTSLGKIDIPKDFLVKSGSVVTFATDLLASAEKEGLTAGTYIKLILNVKQGEAEDEAIYINVANLYSDYKAEENAKQIQLVIGEDHEISATVVEKSITVTELADGAVETVKIKDGAVTGGVGEGSKIAEETIVNGNLVDKTIETGKIKNGAVTADILDTDSVITDKIKNENVTVDKLAENSVTNVKIADATIARVKISSEFEAQIAALETFKNSGTNTTTDIIDDFDWN